ncbi:30S ribosomal protein S27e [Candidatus Gugararchaeum adminiculabundum]|nr:30S ribosomal protein S27e [Candidatus Gugararchaeum adminiculabundum]
MSKFLKVKCECGNEQNIFGNASRTVHCSSCKAVLAKPTGSRARVSGKVTKVL